MVNFAAQKKQRCQLYICEHTIQPPLTVPTGQNTRQGKQIIKERRGGGSEGTEKTLEIAEEARYTEKQSYTLTSISKKGRKQWLPRDYHP